MQEHCVDSTEQGHSHQKIWRGVMAGFGHETPRFDSPLMISKKIFLNGGYSGSATATKQQKSLGYSGYGTVTSSHSHYLPKSQFRIWGYNPRP